VTEIGPEQRRRFEELAMPHLDAAFNLARWLTGNNHDAEDVVQDAFLRAIRYFEGFRGDRFRPWLLQIVRHTAYTWMRENRPAEHVTLDEDDERCFEVQTSLVDEPLAIALRNADRTQINEAIAQLPAVFREVLILRELEDMSYRDIARVAGTPIGTVMSRLTRARRMLQNTLAPSSRPALRTVATVVPRAVNS